MCQFTLRRSDLPVDLPRLVIREAGRSPLVIQLDVPQMIDAANSQDPRIADHVFFDNYVFYISDDTLPTRKR
jgi:hypothetical protein